MRHAARRTACTGVCVLLAAAGHSGENGALDWNAIGRQAAERLSQYVRIDTQNPPGRTVEAAAFLAELAREAGLEVSFTGADPAKPILIARWRGRAGLARPIVLLNHMDVVPADPARWSFPPLSGEIRDGVVYGRGTIDIKGFGIVQLTALRLLGERGIRPRHDVVFLAVPDEESGGPAGVAWLAQNRKDLIDVAAVWDEGGIGVAGAFPAPVIFVAVTEKRALWLRLVAEGPGGHGSRPFPEAAPHRLQRALQRILGHLPPSRLTPVTRRMVTRLGSMFGGLRGFALRNADNPFVWPLVRGQIERNPFAEPAIRDTISLTVLSAGDAPNVIPERASAILDCRLLPGTRQEAFIAELTRVIDDPAVRIEIVRAAEAAPPSPTKHELFKTIQAVSLEVYPGATVTPFMAIGTTDSRLFRQQRVPAYGLFPVLLPPDLLATTHGTDERIPAAALGPAVRVVFETLRRL